MLNEERILLFVLSPEYYLTSFASMHILSVEGNNQSINWLAKYSNTLAGIEI
jgi:hypothetical protein